MPEEQRKGRLSFFIDFNIFIRHRSLQFLYIYKSRAMLVLTDIYIYIYIFVHDFLRLLDKHFPASRKLNIFSTDIPYVLATVAPTT